VPAYFAFPFVGCHWRCVQEIQKDPRTWLPLASIQHELVPPSAQHVPLRPPTRAQATLPPGRATPPRHVPSRRCRR
jgi:hypothetical protein